MAPLGAIELGLRRSVPTYLLKQTDNRQTPKYIVDSTIKYM